MALFTKSPERSVIKDRDAAKSNVDRLAAKVTDSEAAVIAAKSAAQRAALAGDDGALDAAEATEHASLHRLDTLRAAHSEACKLLALLETQLAAMADEKTRKQTAAATEALAAELIEVSAAYDASTAALAVVADKVLLISQEANGLSVFTKSSIIEVAAATEVLALVLHEHARAVTNGLAKAEMPKPAAPPAKPVAAPPKAATVRVFSTRPIKWLDETGKQVSGGKCVDLDLPVATAERALAIGACVRPDHPSRATNIGRWPSHYSLAACTDLDAPSTADVTDKPQHDPLIHSAFQPIDRGKPWTLKIAAGGA